MNPLERLRYIARIEGADPADLALEAAYVLAELAYDRALLVSALRRLLDRNPCYGILWMLAARVAGSVFPEDEAWSLVGDLSGIQAGADAYGFLGLRLNRQGQVSLQGGLARPGLGMHVEDWLELLTSDPEARLAIDSDLVSAQFALVPHGGTQLIEELSRSGRRSKIVIVASDHSLVSTAIRSSLESRLAVAASRCSSVELIELNGEYDLLYQGSTISPAVADRLVAWRIPQELLRTGGPMLG